ncbi:MAG TPA: hypothetical protein DDZ51_09645 [Planctomycetaceae bacterium]|nr:hypothetical protein [Planctomycetaceae bacterium]
MNEHAEFLSAFVSGTSAGAGHGFGRMLISWLANRWRSPKSAPASNGLLAAVALDDLKSQGIPEGFQACRFDGDDFEESYSQVSQLPASIDAGESLWLIPNGAQTVVTDFSIGEIPMLAEVAMEFAPEAGLRALLGESESVTLSMLSELAAGVLGGVGVAIGAESIAAASPAAIARCQKDLETKLGERGVRCRSIRFLSDDEVAAAATPTNGADNDNPPAEVLAELARVKTAADWQELVSSVSSLGVPIAPTALAQLNQMQQQVLDRTATPVAVANRLAEVTSQALQEAGITQPDLRRWQRIEECLRDELLEPETEATPAGVAVVVAKRPSTWFTWNRDELDRKLVAYIHKTIKHCLASCEQSLRSVRDMSALRQIRDWHQELELINELSNTLPSLNQKAATLRLNPKRAKEAAKSLEEAVLTAEKLARQAASLFQQTPGSDSWNLAMLECQRATSLLSQSIQDRRDVR